MTSIIYLGHRSVMPKKAPCTLRKFYDILAGHDWYYQFSDDHGVWQRGNAAAAELQAYAKLSPEHQRLYEDFSKHYFSGEGWGTERHPKPVRP